MKQNNYGIGEREIEFRAWVNGMMFYNIQNGIAFDDGSVLSFSEIQRMPSPTMQYTGLKDKNGVKLFEGDLAEIERDGYTDLIVVKMFTYTYTDKDDFGIWTPKVLKKTKRVGNLFENPELIPQTT